MIKDTGRTYLARGFAPYVFLQRQTTMSLLTAHIARPGNVKLSFFQYITQ